MEVTTIDDIKIIAESLGLSGFTSVKEVMSVPVSLYCFDGICEQLLVQGSVRSYHNIAMTLDEMKIGVAGLVLSRIGFVNKCVGGPAYPKVHAIPVMHVKYPAILFPLIKAIGKVVDENLSYEFRPTILESKQEVDELVQRLTPEFVSTFQGKMMQLASLGLRLADGLSKDHTGSYGYVMAIRAQQIVCPSNQATKGDAVMAALMRALSYQAAVRYPFEYGNITTFTATEAELCARAFQVVGGKL